MSLRERAEQAAKDADYEIASVKQSRAAVQHDLDAAVSNLRDREEDLHYAQKRIEELEGYIANLRREVQTRDDKLDQRAEEVQHWTSECDRLRRQLDDARDRAIQASSEHDRRIKEEKLLQQDMHARLSSAEVEKVSQDGGGQKVGRRGSGRGGGGGGGRDAGRWRLPRSRL